MSKLFLSMAALSAMMACAAAAPPQGAPAPPQSAEIAQIAHESGVACDVRMTRTSHGLLVEALAWGAPGAVQSGDYDFVITKHDGAGSSDIQQGGAFELVGAEPQTLGGAEVSVARGARVRAHLALRDQSGAVLCQTEARS